MLNGTKHCALASCNGATNSILRFGDFVRTMFSAGSAVVIIISYLLMLLYGPVIMSVGNQKIEKLNRRLHIKNRLIGQLLFCTALTVGASGIGVTGNLQCCSTHHDLHTCQRLLA